MAIKGAKRRCCRYDAAVEQKTLRSRPTHARDRRGDDAIEIDTRSKTTHSRRAARIAIRSRPTRAGSPQPQPEALDTQPEALDTQTEALDTQPEALDTQTEALDTQPEAIDTQKSTL
jgi:hypothetical protein